MRKFFFLAIFFFVLASAFAEPVVPQAGDWLIFASSDCEECEELKTVILPALSKRLQVPLPRALLFDIEVEKNYETQMEVETAANAEPGGYPLLVVGGKCLYGLEVIRTWCGTIDRTALHSTLPEAILVIARRGEATIAKVDGPSRVSVSASGGEGEKGEEPVRENRFVLPAEGDVSLEARVLYFAKTGCDACARLSRQLDYATGKIGGEDWVLKVDSDSAEHAVFQYAIARRFGLSKKNCLQTPMLISADRVLRDPRLTDAEILAFLKSAPEVGPLGGSHPLSADERVQAEREIESMVDAEFTFPSLLLAGLVDGINPCAFAVVAFLLSYLNMAGGRKKRVRLLFGLLFSLGVFLCYFLIGIGFGKALNWFAGKEGLRLYLFNFSALFCVVFAFASFVDAARAMRHGAESMKFGMPKGIHRLVHSLIRRNVTKGLLGIGTVLLGMVVSSLELVCTGQVYLPALMIINKTSRGIRSIALLLAYNLAFVLPLLVVVVLFAGGVQSKEIGAWARRHAAICRAAVGILLLVLAFILYNSGSM